MKKMIPVMMLSGIIGLSACGNKTEQPQQNADSKPPIQRKVG